MRPKKYPYSGFKNSKKMASADKLELLVFPNVAIKKGLLEHVETVVKILNDTTDIYFKIPKYFSYEEQKVRVNLSYEKTLEMINSY